MTFGSRGVLASEPLAVVWDIHELALEVCCVRVLNVMIDCII